MSAARRALVTGVGRGIGAAVARRLLAEGWGVLGTFNTSRVDPKALGPAADRVELVQADLATPEGVASVVEAARATPLAAVVNNAGMIEFEREGSFDRTLWERTFAVNLHAPVELALSLGDLLGPGGGVVNICSTDGLTGSYNTPAYAASKAALLNATQSIANVLGPAGVRVNAITPGWIDTAMAEDAAPDAARLTPLGRLGTPEEIAACAAWLLSDEAGFVSGASIVVDGGLTNVDYVLLQEARAAE